MAETIFEQATGFPLLPADQANERIIDLSLALKQATRFCHLRKCGFCFVDCRARVLCEVKGATLLIYSEMPAGFKDLVYA